VSNIWQRGWEWGVVVDETDGQGGGFSSFLSVNYLNKINSLGSA